jgi:hypothetical protein
MLNVHFEAALDTDGLRISNGPFDGYPKRKITKFPILEPVEIDDLFLT